MNVPLADTVAANGTGLGSDGNGYIVGSPPVWKDDSDATYASFAANYIGDGQPAFYGGAAANVASTAITLPRVTAIRVRLRVQRIAGTNIRTPRLTLQSATRRVETDPGTPCPAAPDWVIYPMPFTDEVAAEFAQTPAGWWLSTLPPNYSAPGVPNELHRWNVYEARIEVRSPTEAPPCRMYPRGDGLGVGAGRNFPPPRSQQRSSRGVGYY